MEPAILTVFSQLSYLNVGILFLVIGLYGYGLYGMIVITRILHEIQRNTRRPAQDDR